MLCFKQLRRGAGDKRVAEHIHFGEEGKNGFYQPRHGEIFAEGDKVTLAVYVFVNASVGVKEVDGVVVVPVLCIERADGYCY